MKTEDTFSILSFCVILAIAVIGSMGFTDEIIFMDEGSIIERGTDISFFQNPKSPRTKDFLDKILI